MEIKLIIKTSKMSVGPFMFIKRLMPLIIWLRKRYKIKDSVVDLDYYFHSLSDTSKITVTIKI